MFDRIATSMRLSARHLDFLRKKIKIEASQASIKIFAQDGHQDMGHPVLWENGDAPSHGI